MRMLCRDNRQVNVLFVCSNHVDFCKFPFAALHFVAQDFQKTIIFQAVICDRYIVVVVVDVFCVTKQSRLSYFVDSLSAL